MSEIERNHLKSIRYLLDHFPVVAILGARQTGKSTLMRQALPSAPHFDLENEQDFTRIQQDSAFFLQQAGTPIGIDEAQLCPELFKALRVAVDKKRQVNGQYLLSGSSSPELLSNISESLAGRVAIYELGGFSLDEAFSRPASNFYSAILERKNLEVLAVQNTTEQLYEKCFNGGYPEPFLNRENPIFCDQWFDNYFRTYIDRDVRRLFPGLQLQNYQRFVRMLAAASGQLINASQFAKSIDVSQPTIKNYIQIAEGTFLWRHIPPYSNNLGKRLVKMPKGYIRDSGLLCRLINIASVDMMLNNPAFGAIWESFVIEQIITGMKMLLRSFNYFFYRTHHQQEVDLVLEGPMGLIPIEVKSGYRTTGKQLKQLESFVEAYNCEYGILINNSEEVTRLTKDIIQIPAGCL